MKKKSFLRFFIKRFIIALIIWAVIVGIAFGAIYMLVHSGLKDKVIKQFQETASYLEYLHDKDDVSDNMLKEYLPSYYGDDEGIDVAGAFIQRNRQKTIYSDGLFVCYNNQYYYDDDEEQIICYYNLNTELNDYYADDYNAYCEKYKQFKHLGIQTEISFGDIYRKGDGFYSNKAYVTYSIYKDKYDDLSFICSEKKEYSLTLPDNIDEYPLDKNFKRNTKSASRDGSAPNSKALEIVKDDTPNYFDFSTTYTLSDIIDNKAEMVSDIHIGGDSYYLWQYAKFNFWDYYGCYLVVPAVIFFLILLFFVVLFSIIAYLRYKKKYEMDLYRREMTNTLAHDLKSPLTAISGYAENLCDNVHTEKKEHYAAAILDNTKYMNEIINNVLNLSKVETENVKLEKTDFEIMELAKELISKYQPQIDDKKIKLNLSGNFNITADKSQMTEALENLISNAVRYTQNGGEINISANIKSFKITNTAYDVSSLDFKNIIKPFVKGDNARSGRNGTGLGLAIADNICKRNGFKLKVYNDNGNFIAEISF